MSHQPGTPAWMAGVLPVHRPVARARATYDRVAAVYDLAENPFEYRARNHALRLLAVRPGERVLEIGPGTGHALAALASSAGPSELTRPPRAMTRLYLAARRHLPGLLDCRPIPLLLANDLSLVLLRRRITRGPGKRAAGQHPAREERYR